ncbi:Uncharacterised protein [Kingella potus]|uniref:Lipoprotein n=1 Tax=Kingella potus TaxID=265175 RepID=A0A377QY03_9NEIS|nr:hypothetical protein [Kingella potus]UOP01407.1 hypothetical protein LVJ84_04090 [Kingella potus]STR00274.1 Uncharacterised protein [Kingella potus]
MKTKLPARAALVGSLSLLLAACAVTPPSAQVSMKTVRSENYGSYPKNYERQVRQYLNNTLLDPDSAKIRISPPRKVLRLYNPEAKTFPPKTPKQLEPEGYYLVCAEVNAKNTFGGYTGWQTHRYRFHKSGIMENEQNLGIYGTDFAACSSRDEIFIDTNNVGNVKVNIVP